MLNGQSKQLLVVCLNRPDTASVLAREWIAEFHLLSVHQTQPEQVPTSLTSPLTEYIDLFDIATLFPIKGFKAHLHIKPNSSFKLFKPRPVLDALRPKVEAELERLESLGIISKVKTAEFSTTTIVPVLKTSGQVRMCGDFKVSVNQYLDLTQYPLCTSKKYSNAYPVVKYSPSSIYLMYTFRLSSTTNQSVIWSSLLIKVCTGTIASASVYHRPQRFSKESLSEFYVKSKKSNRTWMILHLKVQTWTIIFIYSDSFSKPCVNQELNSSVRNVFVQPSIKYLGHILSGDGLRPDPKKVEAVVKALPPAN